MYKKGETVGSGAIGDGYSWSVTYVDHVGAYGNGEGKFNWQIEIHHGKELKGFALMTGEDDDAGHRACRAAKNMFFAIAQGLLD